jgi:hypothetical protein
MVRGAVTTNGNLGGASCSKRGRRRLSGRYTQIVTAGSTHRTCDPNANRTDHRSMMAISSGFATGSLSKERLEPAVLPSVDHAQVASQDVATRQIGVDTTAPCLWTLRILAFIRASSTELSPRHRQEALKRREAGERLPRSPARMA